jgi:hypothetical protein
MKTIFYLVLSFSFAISVLFSCSKDENCTAKVFKENIVGSWSISYKVFGFSNSGSGTFNSDGTFSTTPKDLILGTDNDTKTYSINDSTIIFKSASNGFSISIDGIMSSNSCSKIIIEDQSVGGTITLTR